MLSNLRQFCTAGALLLAFSVLTFQAQARAIGNLQSATTQTVPEKPAPPKKHQATGIVLTLTDTTIVIAKGRGEKKTDYAFVRTPKTRTTGTLKRSAKVTVYYHEEKAKRVADRIKVLDESPPPPPVKLAKPQS